MLTLIVLKRNAINMERSLSWNMQPNIVNIVQKLPIKIEIKTPNVSIHTLMIANVKYK